MINFVHLNKHLDGLSLDRWQKSIALSALLTLACVCCYGLELKSLYRSLSASHFYKRAYEISAGFGPVGSSEKKLGQLCVYMGKIVASTLK